VFNPHTGEVMLSLVHSGRVAVLDRAGNRLLTVKEFERAPCVFDFSAKRIIAEFPHPSSSVDLSPDGRRVIAACNDKSVRLWSVDDPAQELARKAWDKGASYVRFSPDGRYIGISGDGSNVRVFSADLTTEVRTLTCGVSVRKFAFSADGELLAALGSIDSGVIEVWQLSSGKCLGRHQHDGAVNSVAFSPCGRFLVTANGDRTVCVYDRSSWAEVALVRHDAEAAVAAFSPNGRWIVSGGWDRTERLWDWRPEDLITSARDRLSRNLTRKEWRTYLGDEPYRKTFLNLPEPSAPAPSR
jgi:WD40 repeat protein